MGRGCAHAIHTLVCNPGLPSSSWVQQSISSMQQTCHLLCLQLEAVRWSPVVRLQMSSPGDLPPAAGRRRAQGRGGAGFASPGFLLLLASPVWMPPCSGCPGLSSPAPPPCIPLGARIVCFHTSYQRASPVELQWHLLPSKCT